jgi:hypothetical protein
MNSHSEIDGSKINRSRIKRVVIFSIPTLVVFGLLAQTANSADKPVNYNRDIRPLLSNTCYKCHGPDANERQAELRLDTEAGAFAALDSGDHAVVRGKSADSALYQRLISKDEDERMPPADSGKQLTAAQIALIKRWIDEGAEWKSHWSFVKPESTQPPQVKHADRVRNGIDQFVIEQLVSEGLAPSPQADRTSLIRRATFDLTGLPPTLAEIDAFLTDKSPGAYEKVVDRLLKSNAYGEQMTRHWLDAARYGDTHGLHLDNERSIWPYRDWLIGAFNQNMPFDQFTVEQLAGDLLPNPTLNQKVATGFNRCNVTTSEGGSIAEEYRVRYAVDRVKTIGTVWMGLSLGCTVCHKHKFDPISQQEFYQLFAYYANTADAAMDGNVILPPPAVKIPSPAQQQQKKKHEQRIAELQSEIRNQVAAVKYEEPKQVTVVEPPKPREIVWVDDALPTASVPTGNEQANSWKWVARAAGPVFSGEKSHTRTATGLSQHLFTGANPPLKVVEADTLFAYVYLDPRNPPKEIMLQFNDGTWEHRAYWGDNRIPWGADNSPSRRKMGKLPEVGKWTRLEVDAQSLGLKPGAQINGWAFTQFDGTVYWDKAGVVTLGNIPQQFDSLLAWEKTQQALKKSSLPKPQQDILKITPDKRSAPQQKQLLDYFIEHVYTKTRPAFDKLHKDLATTQSQLQQLEKAIPSTLVMQEKAAGRLDTFLLIRGEYDKPDKNQKLQPGVPASLPQLPKDAPANRLALARWLVDPAHPLTARVTVNRFWQQYFGIGIVKTAGEFGSQGDWPSHPELLDWLATEFIRSGWDVKSMQKLIVMSGAYRQSSRVTAELYRRDPENRLLARGPRFRLDAEMIRDNALVIGGLLNRQIGGKSVRPYQPGGLWKAVGYTGSNTVNFKQDHGNALYRRSMYTFWKRTSPPPSMALFDAPSREECSVRRERTNTPMQALTLMNDVQYVEAARNFAQRMLTEGGKTPQERITYAFRTATARNPDAVEMSLFLNVLQSHLKEFRGNKEAATKLVSLGESKRDEKLDVADLAAYTMLGNLILNLDETVTKG